MNFENIDLLDTHKELFKNIIETYRKIPPNEPKDFLVTELGTGEVILVNQGENLLCLSDELVILKNEKLIQATSYRNEREFNFVIPPLAFKYYDYLKNQEGNPVQQVEREVLSYLSSESFCQYHPVAKNKLDKAIELLWNDNSQQNLTTIGHLCREAMQEFTTTLANKLGFALAEKDLAKTKNRMTEITENAKTKNSKTIIIHSEALLNLWSSTSNLIQRQEHGGQKEGEPLTWEDGRRVVLYTIFVLYEFDRLC